MQIFNFHLMPYADGDMESLKRHGTAWLTYPNANYDPKIGSALYHRFLDELEYADKLGFDGVCVNEHHQSAYGMMPIPSIFAGVLSRSVKKAKIAVLGRALPLLNNPLVVAEEYAILDCLTRGRLIAGFVRGIGSEYHAMSINPGFSHERFHEAHDLIIQAWTKPGPFPYVGKHYHFDYVNPWPRPYQSPHPPIWIPSSGSTETTVWAAKMKYVYAQTLAPIAQVAKTFDRYREEANKNGYEAHPNQMAWSNSIYIAETDEKALKEAKPHLENYANRFVSQPIHQLLPPGYTSINSMKMLYAKRQVHGEQTAEDLINSGVVIVGSPNTVREKLAAYQDLAGFGISLTKTQFGTLPADMTRANMDAVAQEVLPYFKDRMPSSYKAKAAAE